MGVLAWSDRLVLLIVQAVVRLRHRRVLAWTLASQPPAHRSPLNVAVPRTPNEKMAWRKIFDHDPRFTIVSDKLALKAWAATMGVETADVLWQGRDARDIPPSVLDGRVAVKANHGWGTNLFVENGDPSRDDVVARAGEFLLQDHGRGTQEWGYLGIERKLFVERMLGEPQRPPNEIKLYTFGRRVLRAVLITGRFGDMAAARWNADEAGRLVDGPIRTGIADRVLEGPIWPVTQRAAEIAAEIGAAFDHLRVDFMTDGERLWLGELTVYNMAGKFSDCGHLADSPFARAWDIRRSWYLTSRHRTWAHRLYAAALRRELDRRSAEGRRVELAAAAP